MRRHQLLRPRGARRERHRVLLQIYIDTDDGLSGVRRIEIHDLPVTERGHDGAILNSIHRYVHMVPRAHLHSSLGYWILADRELGQ